MACIGCGLALNADGKGRVEIDTEGGLECLGTGDSGTADQANRGLGIKLSPSAGNSLVVDANGTFVPPAYRAEHYSASEVVSGITDPGYGIGGSTYFGPPASITITNSTAYGKAFFYQAAVSIGTGDNSTPIWIELAVSEGGGYDVPSAFYIEEGTVFTPLTMLPVPITVAPGTSKTLSARGAVYRGNVGTMRASIVAWGGYY